MYRLFDFECEDSHIQERLVKPDVMETKCIECGKPTQRIISPVSFQLDVHSGDFPTATDRWAKKHESASVKP